ncbi:MAG: acetolactate synthase large subunit [Methanobacteriaceae archaeon]
MKGGEAIIKSLISCGADTVFGYPGGQVLPLYDMIYKSDLNHILVRHEQSAVHAADGFARVSGQVGVCIATSGPGATNLVTGIATAHLDSSPVLAIVGQVPTPLIGKDAFQEVDMIGISMPITKHSYQTLSADEIPEVIKSSIHIASTGRPGPIVIDVPKNIQEADLINYSGDFNSSELENMSNVPLTTQGYKPNTKGNIKQVKKAINLIKASKTPVILAGGGVIIANASEELLEFSNAIKAPVTTTLMGKGSFPEEDESNLGMLGMHGRMAANISVDLCDCLIAIGCRFADRTTGNVAEFAPNAKIIHIDIDPAEIGKNVDVEIPIVGDAKNVLSKFNKLIPKLIPNTHSKDNNFSKDNTSLNWFNSRVDYRNQCLPRISYDNYPLKPQQVVKEISEALNSNSIITTDVGQHQMWMAHFHHTQKPRKFISSGGLGTMGFGFPAAIGAKVATDKMGTEEDVVAVTGDGGFLMVAQDLATIKEYDIPVVICLFDNRKLGMVSQWQELFYEGRMSHTDLGSTPDFVKLAEAFGVAGERVEKAGETKVALKNALKSGEPTLLDIAIDCEEILPMVPPGCAIRDIIGDYKLESEVSNGGS